MQFINDLEDNPRTIGNHETKVYKRFLKRIIPNLSNLSAPERAKIYRKKRRAYKNFVNIVFENEQQKLQNSTVEEQVETLVDVFKNLEAIMSVIAKS